MKEPTIPARKPSAGARPWPVSVLLRGWDSPASFVSADEPQRSRRNAENSPYVSASLCVLRGLFLLFDSQQFRGFRPEAFQFFILRLVLPHPSHPFVVPLVSFLLLVQFPVGHGQEKGVEAQLLIPQ